MAQKVLKIYGMRGLLEWHGVVNSNGLTMHVDFVNGSVTAYGVAPATFMTRDALTQHILEHSEQFKSGRIRLERVIALPGEEEEGDAQRAGEDERGRESVEDDGERVAVAVADKQEAIEWLKEHHPEKGYTSVKLRSKSAFESACAECGVSFSIKN